MLHATEVLGAEAYDVSGNFVGRVKELFIEPADQPNRVARVLLARGQFRSLIARYDQIGAVTPGKLTLTTDESALELYQPNEGWLAVRKDLLDQQIIDTSGRTGSTLRTSLPNRWLTTRPTTIGSATISRMLISMPRTSTAIEAST